MRVVVGLEAGKDHREVAPELERLGARHVQGPTPSLPGVLVADMPGDDPRGVVEAIAALPGVRYAEPDDLQSIAGV
jgi:hypothetical protein